MIDDPSSVLPWRPTRRHLIGVAPLLALGVVAGCGSGPTDTGVGNQEVATGGARFSTADEETAKLGSDAAPGVFPRTVVHAAGSTEIPARPQRVVVLDTGELDAVISLGLVPVGIPSTEGASAVPGYLADRVAGVASVGTIAEPNLEAIAALQPDLILGSRLRVDTLYPKLSAIAPTVFSIRPGFPWKENFLLAGEALGAETEAERVLNDYQSGVERVRAGLTGAPQVSLVRFMPDRIRLYGAKSLIGVIFDDVGVTRPENQRIDDLATEISLENIDQADGDVIFYTSYGAPTATAEAQVVGSAQWTSLRGVQAGKAYRVDDDTWFLGLGPTGAGLVLEQLAGFLGD